MRERVAGVTARVVHTDSYDCITELNRAIDTSFIGVVVFEGDST